MELALISGLLNFRQACEVWVISLGPSTCSKFGFSKFFSCLQIMGALLGLSACSHNCEPFGDAGDSVGDSARPSACSHFGIWEIQPNLPAVAGDGPQCRLAQLGPYFHFGFSEF